MLVSGGEIYTRQSAAMETIDLKPRVDLRRRHAGDSEFADRDLKSRESSELSVSSWLYFFFDRAFRVCCKSRCR